MAEISVAGSQEGKRELKSLEKVLLILAYFYMLVKEL